MRDPLRIPYFASDRAAFTHHYFGLYEGTVEDVSDPLSLGRLRARITGIHDLNIPTTSGAAPDRTFPVTPTRNLPWAMPCFSPGQFAVPSVGDTVWVQFRQGHPDYPVWLGTWYGITKQSTVKGRLPGLGPVPPKPTDQTVALGAVEEAHANNPSTYLQPPGNEAPQEAWSSKTSLDPTVHVIYKSPKGATIYVVDDDGSEKFVIADRGGQALEFDFPVSAQGNQANQSRRGVQLAQDGQALPLLGKASGAVRIRLVDAAGQLLQYTAKQGEGKIELTGAGNDTITIEQDGNKVTLLSDLHGKIVLEKDVTITTDGATVSVTQSGDITMTGVNITVNGQVIMLAAPDGNITLAGGNVILTGNVQVN